MPQHPNWSRCEGARNTPGFHEGAFTRGNRENLRTFAGVIKIRVGPNGGDLLGTPNLTFKLNPGAQLQRTQHFWTPSNERLIDSYFPVSTFPVSLRKLGPEPIVQKRRHATSITQSSIRPARSFAPGYPYECGKGAFFVSFPATAFVPRREGVFIDFYEYGIILNKLA